MGHFNWETNFKFNQKNTLKDEKLSKVNSPELFVNITSLTDWKTPAQGTIELIVGNRCHRLEDFSWNLSVIHTHSGFSVIN